MSPKFVELEKMPDQVLSINSDLNTSYIIGPSSLSAPRASNTIIFPFGLDNSPLLTLLHFTQICLLRRKSYGYHYVLVRWDHQISRRIQNIFRTNPQRHIKWRVSLTLFIPKSWHLMITRGMAWSGCTAFSPHSTAKIFLSQKDYINSGTLWNPLTSFRVYKSQLSKIKNHDVFTCLNRCPRRYPLPGVGR